MDRAHAKIIANIQSNVAKKYWPCLYPGCKARAINSHILQRNGVLSEIALNGIVIELRTKGPFQLGFKEIHEFKHQGIGHAMTGPLFCSSHDTTIFKPIETRPFDPYDYHNQVLLVLRSIALELRKKQKNLDVMQRMMGSLTLGLSYDTPEDHVFVHGLSLGVKDMEWFLDHLFADLLSQTDHYTFSTFAYPFIPVCVGGCFSPIHEVISQSTQMAPLPLVIVNVMPLDGELFIVIGNHKHYVEKHIEEYRNSWSNLASVELEKKLTDLIVTRTESWCISPKLHQSRPKALLEKVLQYWNMNTMNLSTEQKVSFNFFSQTPN